jgi:hypothetical protein
MCHHKWLIIVTSFGLTMNYSFQISYESPICEDSFDNLIVGFENLNQSIFD